MTQLPSPPSNSETGGFALLDREIQRWVWEQRWNALRPVQDRAIAPILDAKTDVVVTAATAGGKTEAAFLPICSALVERKRAGRDTGVQAVYISPLKALINDQYRRISGLCSRLGVAVTPWHGDVDASRKTRFRESPSGILLITPESLEAMLVLNGSTAPELFAELSHIVIDELHAFLGTDRGAQLRSLMHRLEHAAGHRVCRVGLSATLADLAHAAEYLRPGGGDRVEVVQDTGAGKSVELQVRGYVDDLSGTGGRSAACTDVADDLYRYARNGHNMVFANSKAEVEAYSGLLSERAERDRLPDPFLPHHGSLSAELRTHAEERLRQRSSPATVVCTSTLELGIDVGWVDTVVQIGVPASVAGLRQRLGRSGRGDRNARLLVYVTEQSAPQTPVEALRLGLTQTAATVDLLLERWYEPPGLDTPNHSTLVQQVLALLAQFHGLGAARLYSLLCASGVFPRIDPDAFGDLLRSMGEHELITQERSGLLLPGKVGERILNHYAFYAAFDTAEEFQIVASGSRLGTMPVGLSVTTGTLLVFGGRTWRVVEVHHAEARILVEPAPGTGAPPGFSGSTTPVGDGVRRRMFGIYTGDDRPVYLDEAAQILLEEARETFQDSGLDRSPVLEAGEDLLLFPWRGDAVVSTLRQLLGRQGLKAETANGVLLLRETSANHLTDTARRLVAQGPPHPLDLAGEATGKHVDKYDSYLPPNLLDQAHADRSVDVPGAMEVLHRLSEE